MLALPAWMLRRPITCCRCPGLRLRTSSWTFALLFRPDIVKVGLDSETALLLREVASVTRPADQGRAALTDSATDGSPLASSTESEGHSLP